MQGFTWSHNTFRKYVVAFGLLFNSVQITRTGPNDETQLIKVPLAYGPQDKLLAAAARVYGDEQQSIATVTPRMMYEMKAPYQDPQRKLNSLNKVRPDPNSDTYQYAPVAWNFPFTLAILVKNVEDGHQIVQQILPFFNPSLTVAIYPFDSNTDYSVDIPVFLDSVEYQDQYEGDFATRRTTMWVLNFTLKRYVYGPVRNTGSVIKQVIVNFDDAAERIVISPGVTAGGLPTKDPLLAIPYQDVQPDDDYAFIIDYINS